MPLVTSNGRALSADYSHGIKAYHDTKGELEQRELQKKQVGLQEQQQQMQQGQLSLQQQKFEQEQAKDARMQQQQQMTQQLAQVATAADASPEQQETALRHLFAINPDLGKKIQEGMGINDAKKAESAYRDANALLNTPYEQRTALIEKRAEEIKARGGDPSHTLSLLNMSPEKQDNALRWVVAANTPAEQLYKQNSPTELQKNLQAGGLQPNTPQYQQAVMQSVTKPQVSINNVGESEEKKVSGKLDAEAHGRLREKAESAQDVRMSAETGLALLDEADTGSLADIKTKAANLAASLGFPDMGKSIANANTNEALMAQLNNMALTKLNMMKGAASERDMSVVQKAAGELKDPKEALRFKLNSVIALSKLEEEKYEFVEDLRLKGVSLPEANKAWRDSQKDLPIISQTIRTENDLPMFYSQFKDHVRNIDPEATDEDIKQAWKEANGKIKPTKKEVTDNG